MLTGIYTAFFLALCLSVTVWALPKLGRLVLALIILSLPYGLVRSYQVAGKIKRMVREEQAREREARVDDEMIDMQ